MGNHTSATIVACATGKVQAGVSIIRISGPSAASLLEAITCKACPQPRRVANRYFYQGSSILDYGLAVYFPAPNSYTGEDVVELHTHGSPFLVDSVIKQVIMHGGQLAKPGEFSERAFLNGKMDLLQSEAVCDLIQAQTRHQAQAAAASLQGVFSKRVQSCAKELENIRLQLEASIDFSDQDPETSAWTSIIDNITRLEQRTSTLIQDAQRGMHTQTGVRIVLVGEPNVGKSSLLNTLTQRDAAIVTDTPGTTRDTIQASINHDGQLIEVTDTAGLREQTDDPIEKIGVEKAKQAIEHADIIWLLVDARDVEERIIQQKNDWITERNQKKTIIVANKCDLLSTQSHKHFYISAQTGDGIQALLNEALIRCDLGEAAAFSARERHITALNKMADKLTKAHACHVSQPEIAAEYLREAQDSLGEILGTYHPDNLLDAIFRNFCLGK